MFDLFFSISTQHFLDVTTIIKNLNYHVIIMYRHKESFNFFINGKIRYRLCCCSTKSAETWKSKVLVSNNVYHVGRTNTT